MISELCSLLLYCTTIELLLVPIRYFPPEKPISGGQRREREHLMHEHMHALSYEAEIACRRYFASEF